MEAIIFLIFFVGLAISSCQENKLTHEKWKTCVELTKDISKCEKYK